MSTIIELSVFPVDKGESVSKYVAMAVKIIRESGLPYDIGPMGTSIEGELDEVMNVAIKCIKELANSSNRVYWTIKGDLRKERSHGLLQKVESVRKKLDALD